MEDRSWFVYIVECRDKKLYTGVSNDLERRIGQHNRGEGCRFTRSRTPVKLVFKKKCISKSVALKYESEIKSWERSKKLTLIGGSVR